MLEQSKVIFICLVIAFVFTSGYYVRGKFDLAAQEKILAAQIEEANKKQKEVESKAAEAETKLATERKKTAYLNKKWSAYRATTHINCELSDDVIGLLHDATSPLSIVPR